MRSPFEPFACRTPIPAARSFLPEDVPAGIRKLIIPHGVGRSTFAPSKASERVIGKQIEAARVALTRYMKRTGKVWTRIFPNIPVSKKPTEVRMGKGKGSPEYYACRVKPGRILFEVDGVSEQIAKEALYKASAKLPIKTKTIKRFS